MDDPLAAMSAPVAGEGEEKELAGNTETSAPLSIRKYFPDTLSLIEIVPFPAHNVEMRGGLPGASAARRSRFPGPAARSS